MGQQVLPSSGNMLIKILAAAISPVQGFVCEQLFPDQSPLIPATLLPGSQVPQQAVACHLSQVQAQQSGTEQVGYLNKQAGMYLSRLQFAIQSHVRFNPASSHDSAIEALVQIMVHPTP